MNIGLTLGSRSFRGCSRIRVINALAEQGITPDIICGPSIGALVGESHVFCNLHSRVNGHTHLAESLNDA